MAQVRPTGITIVAALMIVFGGAEVATGITHNFLSLISTTAGISATYGAAAVGALYGIAGVLLLTKKRGATLASVACLLLVIVGRVALVLTGLYPIDSFLQIFSMIVGTAIAGIFAAYIWLMRGRAE
jgi:hypothetical protein